MLLSVNKVTPEHNEADTETEGHQTTVPKTCHEVPVVTPTLVRDSEETTCVQAGQVNVRLVELRIRVAGRSGCLTASTQSDG